ncbi:MAG TPA: type II toxin-antitoxin system death-on-curing family toxin [Hyphomonadaceae bacterium]|nr:type II toxin-antitoxin system death-on-curing family toxin [Hyphomonadaceae bacterium]HPN07354.1 type II toxin-antitoxin system death-on-curing family toxin [Hyphomonadaceae bacterium]
MSEPVWLPSEIILAIHDEQIAEHGGLAGVRDVNLLDSALARPKNAFAYGERDLCVLAALYASGIVRNHPFADGNKRSAFVACELFLTLNGLLLMADDDACVTQTVALAAGELDEHAFSAWLHANVEPA